MSTKTQPASPKRRKTLVTTAGIVVGLVVVCLAALLVGPVALAPGNVLRSLLANIGIGRDPLTELQQSIIWELRAPRVVLAAIVGGALSIAGASYQGVFRNPLVDPYLLGAAAGAGVGATVAIVLTDNSALLTPLAFVGALVGVSFAYLAASLADPLRNPANILLAGVATASFLTAIQTYLQQRNAKTLPEVYAWILGHLTTAGWDDVLIALPYVGVSSLVLSTLGRRLDVLALGDEKASTLGVEVKRLRALVVVAASLATAAAVSVSGLIGFVGLVVPHIVRLIVGRSNSVVLPLSFVLGAAFMVVTDVAARTVMAPAEIPVGVVTAFIGAPFFFAVLWRSARST